MHGLAEELTQDLKHRVVKHRNRFMRIFYGRYRELIPSLITYKNTDNITSIDFLKVEVMLRGGMDVVIGKNSLDNLVVLGYANYNDYLEDSTSFYVNRSFNKNDINFIIPNNLIRNDYKEISYQDDCESGNFIVLKNKTFNYVSDIEIIKHYTFELAELVLSRYSISMQAKINTIFMTNVNDETVNQAINEIYNGSPFIKLSKLFNVNENVLYLNNEHLASNFQELKREYQNKISELNNMLGINSLAVEKTSGVSDTEAKSNRSYTTSNANIYLTGRQQGLDRLNKRYDLDIQAIYNDEVASEINDITKDENTEMNDTNEI